MSPLHKPILLPMDQEIRIAKRDVLMMKVSEVDFVEIFSMLASALRHRGSCYTEADSIERILSTWGSSGNEKTTDGEILIRIWRMLFNRLRDLYDEFNLWNADGMSPYMFDRFAGDFPIFVYVPG